MQIDKLLIDDTFMRNYECTPLEAIPSAAGVTLYCFPGGYMGGYVNGPILEIVPHADSCEMWVGSFAMGHWSPNAATGVYTMPAPSKLLVVAKGEAYIVNVEKPSEHEHLRILPVMGAIAVQTAGVIVLYDFTRLEGYDESGRRWKTPSLSWDGLRQVSFDGKAITGEAWDSPNDAWVSFCVDPTDGSFEGGASPELLGV